MLKELTKVCFPSATTKNIFILLLCCIFINLIIFPTVFSGNLHKPLDVRFFYTPEEAYRIIANYDERFRTLYAIIELTVDMVYPVIYCSLLSLVNGFIFNKAFSAGHRFHNLIFFPFVIMPFDFLENIGIVTMLYQYPATFPVVAKLTSFFTIIKFVLIFFVLLGQLLFLLRKID